MVGLYTRTFELRDAVGGARGSATEGLHPVPTCLCWLEAWGFTRLGVWGLRAVLVLGLYSVYEIFRSLRFLGFGGIHEEHQTLRFRG